MMREWLKNIVGISVQITFSMPLLRGVGACLQENFEKNTLLRLNLEADLMENKSSLWMVSQPFHPLDNKFAHFAAKRFSLQKHIIKII